MRYPRMDVEPTRWPWSPQSKPSDLVKKRVIFHSEQIFDPPFRPQGGLGWKKKFTNQLGHDFCVRPGFYRSFGVVLGELSKIHFAKSKVVNMVWFQENNMLPRQNLIFLDSEPIFDPLSELKEVSDKKFEFTNRLRHECGIPGWL